MNIAVDLGGTNIRAAIVEKGICRDTVSVPCNARGSEDDVVDQVSELVAGLSSSALEGIGIGVPSIVDVEKGIVYNAVNIPSWREVHLKSKLEKRFGVRVEVNNDCNCFALGEHRYGAGRGFSDMIGITLGTGIGAGVIANGQLYSGLCAGAGEIGSLPYLDSDYEHYCSSLYLRDCHHTDGGTLAAAAAEGNPEALRIWDEFGSHLGDFVKAILFTYAPEAIVIGGGIAASMPLFEPAMRRRVDTFPYPAISSRCRIVAAQLKEANLLGAASLLD